MRDFINDRLTNDIVKSVYPYNELSIQELLNRFYSEIKNTTEISNKALDFLKWLIEQGLEENVVNELQKMYDDGRLTQLIDDLANDLNGKIETVQNEVDLVNTSIENINDYIQTDETTGIVVKTSLQEAINQSENHGLNVILTKDITEQFTPIQGLTIQSPNKSKITVTNPIVINEVVNLTFKNINFVGDRIFELTRCHRIKFINCTFNSNTGTVIKMDRCFYAKFENCSFTGNQNNFIVNDSCAIDGEVLNSDIIDSCYFFYFTNAIKLTDTQHFIITNSNFEHIGERGVSLLSTGDGYWSTTTNSVNITGCRFETAYNTSGKPVYEDGLTTHVYIDTESHNNMVVNNFMQTYYVDYGLLNQTIIDLGSNNFKENNGPRKDLYNQKVNSLKVLNYNSKGLVYDKLTNKPLGFNSEDSFTYSRFGLKTSFTTQGSQFNQYHRIRSLFKVYENTSSLISVDMEARGGFSIILKNETDNVNLFVYQYRLETMTPIKRIFYGNSFNLEANKTYSINISKSTTHDDPTYPVLEGIINNIMVVNTGHPGTIGQIKDNLLIKVDETIVKENIKSYGDYIVTDNVANYITNFNNDLS